MGVNRAKSSVKPKPGKDYLFRNIASAFPDTGKNMLLKNRALPKRAVSGAIDHSPWHLRLYSNPAHIKEDQARFSILNKNFYTTPLNQKEAVILNLAPKKIATGEPFYQNDSYGTDDAFEPNNTMDQSFDLSQSEDRWLGSIANEGVQWDEDWYKIWISPQYRRLVLDLRFQHYLGDMDLRLFDSQGTAIAVSQGLSDDEFINLVLDHGGVYYVQVSGLSRGNRYDLKYSTFFTGGGDDEYEDNDTVKMAFDLRSVELKWLSEVKGEGIAADDDYYLIQAFPGRTRLIVDLRVDVDRGDVDMRLLNSLGNVIASSSHIGDDDYIDFTVSVPGNYYLKIYPFNPQLTFNMYDLKWQALKPNLKFMSQLETTNFLTK